MKDRRRASEGRDAKLGLETMVQERHREVENPRAMETRSRKNCADGAEDERKISKIEWQEGCEKCEIWRRY